MKVLTDFPEVRYKHCYGVGKWMYHYAKDILCLDENFCIEMFVLGNIHDIGYKFNKGVFSHDILLDSVVYKKTENIINYLISLGFNDKV